MNKGDVGMAQINFCSVRLPVNAWCYTPTSLPQKQVPVAKIKFFQL